MINPLVTVSAALMLTAQSQAFHVQPFSAHTRSTQQRAPLPNSQIASHASLHRLSQLSRSHLTGQVSGIALLRSPVQQSGSYLSALQMSEYPDGTSEASSNDPLLFDSLEGDHSIEETQCGDAHQWSVSKIRSEAQIAQKRLAPFQRQIGIPTPLLRSQQLSVESSNQGDLFLKLENMTATLSFKIRGALNAMLAYQEMGKVFDTAVAASAGNHSQGVALAAQLLGKKSLIVMPVHTDPAKVERTKHFGAEVVLFGDSLEESVAHANQLLEADFGRLLIHPYDDPYVVAGQSTVGLEIMEQLPDVDTVIVPSGGGGLIAGIAAVLPQHVRLIGVQAEAMSSFSQSLQQGEVQSVAHQKTVAGGIAVGRAGKLPVEICLTRPVETVQLSETALKQAVRKMFEEGCLKVEGAAATGPAALFNQLIELQEEGDKRVAVVITGGNIGPELFDECMKA